MGRFMCSYTLMFVPNVSLSGSVRQRYCSRSVPVPCMLDVYAAFECLYSVYSDEVLMPYVDDTVS